MRQIRLSKKYGLNPAIPYCFYCNKAKNEVILAGVFGGKEAPRAAVWDLRPCDACADFMKQGVILISVKDGEDGGNPYRTGGWCVVKDEAIERMISNTDLREHIILRARVAFVPDEAWDFLGLPRGTT